MKVTYGDYALAWCIIYLLGVAIFGMTVFLAASPAFVNLATSLCILGGTGVLGTALLRVFCKKSS